ncbi:MAG: DUF1949 domain-containing protein [Clostridia bacterium]|nr:DUF1949 domain-containing protein [Clostridia bacterium]
MTEYAVPTGRGEAELVEKRSRFLGHVFPVESETDARACIEEMKKKYHDARHNCWCFRLKEGGVERYSDDGEPQGTAGQPMLNVFQREGVENVCCVVTRYFGGILLGAGGLVRAYTQGAKDALDAAGVSVVRRWSKVMLVCPYHLFEQVKVAIDGQGGVLGETEYAEDVAISALFLEEKVLFFIEKVVELTAGGITPRLIGEELRAVPREIEL